MTREEAIHFAECLKNNWTINLDDLKDFCDMAIEALENNNDKLAEDLQNCLEMYKKKKEEVKVLKQTAWIPCSERLPKEDGHYIVYAPTYSGGSSSSKEHHDGVMFSAFKKGKWSIEHGYHKRPNCVRAWMPLPDPWRGGTE